MLVACGDNGNSSPDLATSGSGLDMTMSIADMAQKPDMAMMKLGCNGVLMCIQTSGDFQGCAAKGTTKAGNLLLTAAMCGQTACEGMTTGDGAMDCSGGLSDFQNPTCQACIGQILMDGAAGNGPCKSQVAACLADMP
jgi:hypothetical protein